MHDVILKAALTLAAACCGPEPALTLSRPSSALVFPLIEMPAMPLSEALALLKPRAESKFAMSVIPTDPCLDLDMWREAPATNADGVAAQEPWRRNRQECAQMRIVIDGDSLDADGPVIVIPPKRF